MHEGEQSTMINRIKIRVQDLVELKFDGTAITLCALIGE